MINKNTEQEIRELLRKFFRDECTPVEKQDLAGWFDQSKNDFLLRRMLEEAWAEFEPLEKMPTNRANQILSAIFAPTKIEEHEDIFEEAPVRRLWLRKLSVAVAIIFLASAGSYYLFFNHPPANLVISTPIPSTLSNDAEPGKTQAILTLADGSLVNLDTGSDKTIARQGNTNVLTRDGKLEYNSAEDQTLTPMYNLLSTHRGELFPVMLSDGTRVWLNSASTLQFPVAFNGAERMVELTGEGYFEVARNPAKPFKVRLNGMEIEVLGTHFNINGYADEPVVKTTLIEGSLRVTKGNAKVLLSMGQQAGLKPNGEIELLKNVDTLSAMSWKEGFFHFKNTGLENVMRQLSRWYDVEVEYQISKPYANFTGEIRKESKLSEALSMLELSQVHTKIVGKKIIVVP